jgi:hypothetical protein
MIDTVRADLLAADRTASRGNQDTLAATGARVEADR